MGNVTHHPVPINPSMAMHAGLVVLGTVAAMLVVYSPAPAIGMLVLAIVLGVEIPAAVWSLIGVRLMPNA